jgi:5-methylcytosine-specific restriction endonuclease McrA
VTNISPELRRQIWERAGGRCEYCRIPDDYTFDPHEIDHIYAEKHGGETTANNLCLCCWICNRNKGSDLTSLDPETGKITPLFHPRNDRWEDHFRLNGALIEPLTPEGRVTVRLLQLNKRERVDERKILITIKRYP